MAISFPTGATVNQIYSFNGQNWIYTGVYWKVYPQFADVTPITGGTFNKNTSTLSLTNSGGVSVSVTGLTDTFVTGGTYNSGTGTATFTNNTGGTFNVVGFSSGGGSFTGGTVLGATNFTASLTALTFVNSTIQDSLTQPSISTENRQLIDTNGLTSVDWELRSTYDSASTLSLDYLNRRLYDSDGFLSIKYKERKLVNSSGVEWLDWQTGTIDTFSTIKSSTISATTYQNLPTDIRVTGSTYSNNTLTFRNNTGGTFSVLFNTFTGGTFNGNLSVTGTTSSGTISATTYQNLPTDVRVTGSTYSNNTFTYTNNTGGTFNVNFNTLTGATINGNLTITGTTQSSIISGTTISGGTFYGNSSNVEGLSITNILLTQFFS